MADVPCMHCRADLAPAVVHGWQEHVFHAENVQKGFVLVGCQNFVQGTCTTQVLAVTTPLKLPARQSRLSSFQDQENISTGSQDCMQPCHAFCSAAFVRTVAGSCRFTWSVITLPQCFMCQLASSRPMHSGNNQDCHHMPGHDNKQMRMKPFQ